MPMLRPVFRSGALRLALLAALTAMPLATASAGLFDHSSSSTGAVAMSSASEEKAAATPTLPAYASTTQTKTPATETKPVEKSETPAVPDAVKAGAESHGAAFKPPAAGMALIRVIDGTTSAADVRVNGKTYSAAAGSIGRYYSIPQGPAEVTNGSETTSASLMGGQLYSILVGKGKLEVREDPRTGTGKSQFLLVNLSSAQGVSIKTSAGAASDVGPAEPGNVATAQINPINITLGVYDANHTLLATLTGLTLEKDVGYAVLVYPGRDGKPAVAYGRASGG